MPQPILSTQRQERHQLLAQAQDNQGAQAEAERTGFVHLSTT